MGSQDAQKAGEPVNSSQTADKQGTSGAASSGSWGWGKGWLPTAALQQVAAGVLSAKTPANACVLPRGLVKMPF